MKRTVKERRQRNRELAEMDSRNRCAVCKRPMSLGAAWFGIRKSERYCSEDCANTADERETGARR